MENKSVANRVIQQIAPNLAYMQVLIANVCLVDNPANTDWVLVDAGLPNTAVQIRQAAEALYGKDTRPRAIILTHGHFDHVGAVNELADGWNVPVYAHELEMPYLTGKASYPPPDPGVSNGLMAKFSPLYPRDPINLGSRVQPLPADGITPFLPGWRWIFTPGHTPGHVSLFRDADRVMIVGDAFTTVKQESAFAVLTQNKEVHGPPAYFTVNWPVARQSIERLQALNPIIAITGHGRPMRDGELRQQLEQLIQNFQEDTLPEHGRYVEHPVPLNAPRVEETPRV